MASFATTKKSEKTVAWNKTMLVKEGGFVFDRP
jgi:hypothetical protein